MGFITGKVFAGIAAGAITLSAGTFAVTHVDSVKNNIDRLEDAFNLLQDEASVKIGGANKVITEKNDEITRLDDEVTRLETQLAAANAEITKGDQEIGKANDEVNKANAAVENLADESDAAADRVEASELTTKVQDDKYQVSGLDLGFTIVQNQDETNERTIRLFNPNTAAVDNVKVVSTTGTVLFEGSLGGGEYKTFTKNKSGEMLKLMVGGVQKSLK